MGAPSTDRWAAIVPLLDAALELAPEQRPAFLAERCTSDPELRHDIERILAAVDQADQLLGSSALEVVAPLAARIVRQERFAPGDRLGVYRIEREIGRGGMAMVYLARDTRHDRLVALKVLDRSLSSSVGADRFIRETAIAARLNHPHILPLFDSGLLDGGAGEPVLYYAMPYVDGRSLRERLRQEGPLPMPAAVAIARQVAEALDHAHEHGIVHRDIKPENVLLAGEHAFVADFGIALALDGDGGDRLTRTGLSVGTPTYMSPEQATTGRLDGRSDLYSLGVVVYEMLAGQPPFTGSTARTVLTRHAMVAAAPLRSFRPAVPPAVERVVARSLAKTPDARFPSGRALTEALAAAAATRPTPADTVYSWVTAARYAIRRRAVVAAVAITGLALAAGAALMAHARTPANSALDPAVVAVVPYRVSTADSSLRYLREGVVDLLASRLAGTETLRPVSSRVVLDAWRGNGNARGDLSPAQTQALAVAVGAGRVIEGEIVGGGAHITIASRMLDVRSRRLLARETFAGPADSLPVLLDRLAGRLLTIASGQPGYRLASLEPIPLAALQAYLNGEAQDRRGFGDSAAASFAEAVRIDSTFALAALRLKQTSWDDDHGAQGIAWRYRDRLSDEDRANLTVTLGPSYPGPSHYREGIAAAEQYVQLAPDEPLAWIELGAGLFEDAPLFGLSEAHSRAEAAFARAVALDSTSVPALGGLSITATALGDTATAAKALAMLRRQRQDSTSQIDFEPAWFLAMTTGDTSALHRILRRDSLSLASGNPHPAEHGWAMLRLGIQQGFDLRDASGVLERALPGSATLNERAGIRWNQAILNGIRGRSDSSPGAPYDWNPAGLSTLPRSRDLAAPILNFLFTDLDSAGWSRSGAALLRSLGSQSHDLCCLTRFAAGQYALATNRLDLAARAAADLRRFHGSFRDADQADTVYGAELSRELALVLEAQIAAQRHDPSAGERLRLLDSMLANPIEDRIPLLGNLVAAHLHEARGELTEARAALARRWWGHWVDPGYVVYHREEGRLAALAGDTAAAIQSYRRYLTLRGDADPQLQPRVRAVRAALAALEHTTAGH